MDRPFDEAYVTSGFVPFVSIHSIIGHLYFTTYRWIGLQIRSIPSLLVIPSPSVFVFFCFFLGNAVQ